VAGGVRRYPVESGRCAALARIVFVVGQRRDNDAGGKQVPKYHHGRSWDRG